MRSEKYKVQAATGLGSVKKSKDLTLDNVKEAILESARTTVQDIGKGADALEISVIGTTVATGGLSAKVTVPHAEVANGVDVFILLAEVGVDLTQDWKVRYNAKTSIIIKATGRHLFGKAVDDVVSGFSTPHASDDIVRAMPAPVTKIVENNSNRILKPKEDE